jgi:hypothetical protein
MLTETCLSLLFLILRTNLLDKEWIVNVDLLDHHSPIPVPSSCVMWAERRSPYRPIWIRADKGCIMKAQNFRWPENLLKISKYWNYLFSVLFYVWLSYYSATHEWRAPTPPPAPICTSNSVISLFTDTQRRLYPWLLSPTWNLDNPEESKKLTVHSLYVSRPTCVQCNSKILISYIF